MKLEVQAQVRTAVGKGVARQTRREGRIPGVLYGQGKSLSISMDPADVRTILIAQGGSTALITLHLTGESGKTEDRITVIQDFQRDPITWHILHVDLFEVSMSKAVKVKVHVNITGGTPIGVKRDKGILHHGARELHVECLPGDIPDQIEVDASNLEINQGIHVRELDPGAGVKILDDPELMIVNVAVPILTGFNNLASPRWWSPIPFPSMARTKFAQKFDVFRLPLFWGKRSSGSTRNGL